MANNQTTLVYMTPDFYMNALMYHMLKWPETTARFAFTVKA